MIMNSRNPFQGIPVGYNFEDAESASRIIIHVNLPYEPDEFPTIDISQKYPHTNTYSTDGVCFTVKSKEK